jgi:hypothetical protein
MRNGRFHREITGLFIKITECSYKMWMAGLKAKIS